MVTGSHPDDIDLFDYVEGDMPDARRAELEVHLATCARCAREVARVRDGRDALRESQFLQLSKPRRDAIFLDFPPQRREARRRAFSLKPALVVLASLGAAAAITAVVINVDGTGSNEESAGGGAAITGEAPTAVNEAAGGGTEGGGETAEDRAGNARLLFSAGPADAVAAELRRKGLAATVVGDHVEVRGATRAEVKQALGQALSERRDGDVRIVIVH
jgi:anti-sigma factor RsiW